MKKIFIAILFVSVLVLTSGAVLAATTPTQTPTKYTVEQQACIKAAQDKRSVAVKAATDALNAATKDAVKTRQDAIKAATDALNAATKDAVKTRQDAIKAAQKNNDAKARVTEIKAANGAYNNDATVKQARVPYMAAFKAATDAYNNDATVKQARVPYMAAFKAANDQFQSDLKVCLGGSSSNSSATTGGIINNSATNNNVTNSGSTNNSATNSGSTNKSTTNFFQAILKYIGAGISNFLSGYQGFSK